MSHPTEDELRALLDDRSPPDRAEAVAEHLDGCESCREVAERLTEVPRDLWATLVAAGGRAAAPSPPIEGPTIPGYEDFRPLGRGGCGVVYRAAESVSGRRVAVKLLRGGAIASPRERAWFLDEARAAANLRHPNIVTVLAVGEGRGQPYYAMEYLPSGSLAGRLDGAPFDLGGAAALVLDLALAIQHAHEAGVIHRDLKPGNILLDAPTRPELPWTPKVADFGMAKLTEAAARTATPTQAIFGTPGYMAPEQAFGRSRDVGPAADVYGLGAILYELLTGRPPFQGGTAYETLLLVRDEDPVSPGRLRPGLPKDLETICLKCLEKEPGRRYASAARLADDLEAFRAGRPVAARPVGRLGRLRRWTRREPVVAGLSAAAILLAATLLVVVTAAWRRSVAQQVRLTKSVETAERRGKQLLNALAFSAESVSKLFEHPALVPLVNREAVLQGLDALEQAADLPDSPEDQHRLAYAMLQMANGLYHLGESEPADRANRRALAILSRLSRAHPELPDLAYHYAQGCMQSAALERRAGRPDEEMRLHDEARRTAEELVARHPGRDAYAAELAVFRSTLARDLLQRGRDDEAAPLVERSLAVNRRMVDRYPFDPVRYGYFFDASHVSGVLKLRRGDLEGYRELVRERLDLCDRARSQPDWPIILPRLLNDASDAGALQKAGFAQDAGRLVATALDAWRETLRREPESPTAREWLASWLLVDGYRKWPTDPAAAGGDFRESVAILESLLEGPQRSNSLLLLAWHRCVCPDPSIRDTAKAVAHARDRAREFDRGPVVLGICLCEDGDYGAAREELERRLADPSPLDRGWPERVARLYLALAYRKLGMPDRAAAELRDARARPPDEALVAWPGDMALRRIEALLAERP